MTSGGTLYVVATPLGNAEDLSPRARRVLQQADVLLAEDTRRAGLLFQRLGLVRHAVEGHARFLSFHDHNEAGRVPQVLAFLRSGQSVALISDAGTPLLSDPGYRLVAACRQAGLNVSPVPGPSAPMAALSACGLPPQPFVFLGFLPRRSAEQRRLFEQFGRLPVTLVLFERKDRVQATLALAAEVLGQRQVCVARELTKDHEEFILSNLGALSAALAAGDQELRGEVTLVIGPPGAEGGAGQGGEAEAATPEAEVLELAAALAAQEAETPRPKVLARQVAAQVRGWTAKDVYEALNRHKEQ